MSDLPPPRGAQNRQHAGDDRADDAEADALRAALVEMHGSKAAERVASAGSRRLLAGAIAIAAAAAMLGIAWMGGVAGAWLLFFIGVFGVPAAGAVWLAVTLWGVWRQPLARPPAELPAKSTGDTPAADTGAVDSPGLTPPGTGTPAQ